MRRILLPALALGAMSSAALAEPMALTDAQMDEVTAAGFAFVDAQKYVLIDEDIKKKVNIDKWKNIHQRVDVRGFFAEADGAANCHGYGCETLTYAITDASAFPFKDTTVTNGIPVGYSTSASGAESAAPGFLDFFDNGDKGGNGKNGTDG